MMKRLALLVALTVFATHAAAQHHCRIGVPFEPSSLESPPILDGIGNSHFPITTISPEAQRWFDQGVNLLHSFWDFEAYRAFQEAARLDPQAPMPHWGIFQALGFNAVEMAEPRKAALARAIDLGANASERERHYIRAAEVMQSQGRVAFIAEMEALIDRFPDDVEAKLFLANTLSTPPSSYLPDGRPREGKLYGQAILRNVLHTHPDLSAAHHYWIHAVENGPRPEEGLESAAKLPTLAPRSGHLLHMPGHIYYRLGRHEEARLAFLRSRDADLSYMKTHGVSPIANWNYVHNLDYLVGSFAESGRYAEGMRWAKELESIPVAEERLAARGSGYILYGGLTASARLQMRFGKWSEAAANLRNLVSRATSARSRAYLEGVLAYAEGRSSIDAKRLDAAEASLAKVGAPLSAPAHPGDWYSSHATKILAVHEQELRGLLLAARGQYAEAVAALLRAIDSERNLGYWEPPHYARPVYESLARVHHDAGKFDDAINAWNEALRLRPNNAHALSGLAESEIMAKARTHM
jgi:tetratricopeptide (TPR) repeat protein